MVVVGPGIKAPKSLATQIPARGTFTWPLKFLILVSFTHATRWRAQLARIFIKALELKSSR